MSHLGALRGERCFREGNGDKSRIIRSHSNLGIGLRQKAICFRFRRLLRRALNCGRRPRCRSPRIDSGVFAGTPARSQSVFVNKGAEDRPRNVHALGRDGTNRPWCRADSRDPKRRPAHYRDAIQVTNAWVALADTRKLRLPTAEWRIRAQEMTTSVPTPLEEAICAARVNAARRQ